MGREPGLYVSSRMLLALTRHGDAPQMLAHVNGRGTPVPAILAGTILGFAAVLTSYVSPGVVFPFLVKSNGTVALFVYLLIALSELRLRRKLERENPERLVVRMWLYPWLTAVAIAAMLGILAAMAFIPDQRVPLAAGLGSLAIAIAFYGLRRSRLVRRRRHRFPRSPNAQSSRDRQIEGTPLASARVGTFERSSAPGGEGRAQSRAASRLAGGI